MVLCELKTFISGLFFKRAKEWNEHAKRTQAHIAEQKEDKDESRQRNWRRMKWSEGEKEQNGCCQPRPAAVKH